eukprot:TRINITY_DN1981_c0_g1_i1.p1 TRINITY_DN1981_c0_g1~~TRINITY_DN1981_c0_g1_i1.p1  ORF type:complete len:337 (-),score=60.34 TRINITY_DN1981_c0_g1_i1:49-1059(-)
MKLKIILEKFNLEIVNIVNLEKYIFEVVYRNKNVILKILPMNEMSYNEIRMMERVKKLGIVNMIQIEEWFEYDNMLILLMEKAECDLYDYINSIRGEENYMDIVSRLSLKLICGLHELHTNNICHNDIKPANIFIDPSEDPKVYFGDFGFSKQTDSKYYMETSKKGTISYASPELFIRYPHNPFEADVYSLGMVFYFMFSKGKIPFSNSSFDDSFCKYTYKSNLDFSLVDSNSIINEMCSPCPENRPTIEYIKSYFSNYFDNTNANDADNNNTTHTFSIFFIASDINLLVFHNQDLQNPSINEKELSNNKLNNIKNIFFNQTIDGFNVFKKKILSF